MWENIKLTLKGSVNDYDNHDDFNDTAADDDGNVDGGGIDNDDGNNDNERVKDDGDDGDNDVEEENGKVEENDNEDDNDDEEEKIEDGSDENEEKKDDDFANEELGHDEIVTWPVWEHAAGSIKEPSKNAIMKTLLRVTSKRYLQGN